MKYLPELVKKYLTRVGVEDAIEQGEFDFSNGGSKFVPLAEHDRKYHPNGYKEDESCEKRENMEKNDPVDTEVDEDAKKKDESSESDKQPMTDEEKEAKWVYYLRHISDDKFGEIMNKYGYEDKYPKMYKLIVAERDRRVKIDMDRWYKEHGEQV